MSLVAGLGATAGVGGVTGVEHFNERYPLPFYRGYAATVHSGRRTEPRHREVAVTWGINTTKKLVALTFDDGPMPNWTPQVHAILAEHRVRATFFLIGERALAHRDLLAGQLGEHEMGNHTWAHRDLARMEYADAYEAIERGARAIATVTGTEPTLLRPPYGHLGGSALLAAADFGASVVLWNQQMVETDYRNDQAGLVDYIVGSCTPGTIMLAHDTGADERLVAIKGLPDMIKGLRTRGFEFVTVSELLGER
ncbi:polysaccharide deacetylase family protein [Micromonospora sp. NPDC048999]|uniref:polysaccharide deacetylase family protein n=1 Tax=Micromonospora sp. NPDC048999 TaxID=3155391 RepID=UPI0033F6478A